MTTSNFNSNKCHKVLVIISDFYCIWIVSVTFTHREVFLVVVDDVFRLWVVEAELSVHRLEADPARVEHALQHPGVILALFQLRQDRPERCALASETFKVDLSLSQNNFKHP